MAPPGDQISRLLHVVVIEICQRIVSYTDELVVSGMVVVKADGVQVCRVPFEDAIKGKDHAATNGDPQTGESPSSEDNQEPHLLVRSEFDGGSMTPLQCSDERNLCELSGSAGSLTIDSSSVEKATDSLIEGVTEGSGRSTQTLKHKEFGLRNGTMVNVSRASSVSNLGEMVMEYWQQITPELLKASALLCKLGELQQAMDAQGVALADRSVTTEKPNTGGNHSKPFGDSDFGSEWIPTRSNFLQMLGSDYRVRNQCRLCLKVFTFATNLRRHQRNFHGRPLSRDARQANSSSAFNNSRSFADLSRLGSRRINPVVLGEYSGRSLRRAVDSVVMKHSIPSVKILDRELETNCVNAADRQASTSHSATDQNLENETGKASIAPLACQDEELLEVCDIRPTEKKILGADCMAFSASVDANQKNGSRERLKAFDVVQVVGVDRASVESYAHKFDDCWDKSGDSMLDPISVDVSDGNAFSPILIIYIISAVMYSQL